MEFSHHVALAKVMHTYIQLMAHSHTDGGIIYKVNAKGRIDSEGITQQICMSWNSGTRAKPHPEKKHFKSCLVVVLRMDQKKYEFKLLTHRHHDVVIFCHTFVLVCCNYNTAKSVLQVALEVANVRCNVSFQEKAVNITMLSAPAV